MSCIVCIHACHVARSTGPNARAHLARFRDSVSKATTQTRDTSLESRQTERAVRYSSVRSRSRSASASCQRLLDRLRREWLAEALPNATSVSPRDPVVAGFASEGQYHRQSLVFRKRRRRRNVRVVGVLEKAPIHRSRLARNEVRLREIPMRRGLYGVRSPGGE